MEKNEIKAFSFYRSYYESLINLNEEEAKEIAFSMMKYVFEDEEPIFTGISKSIWTLIEPTLNKSKNRSNSGSGAPKGNQNARKYSKNEIEIKEHIKTIEIKKEENRKGIEKLFLEYVNVREEKEYTISDSVIKRLINKLNELGKNDEEKNEILLQAINGSWKDFYELKVADKKEDEPIYETI